MDFPPGSATSLGDQRYIPNLNDENKTLQAEVRLNAMLGNTLSWLSSTNTYLGKVLNIGCIALYVNPWPFL